MTTDEYRGAIRALGLTPRQRVGAGAALHEDGQGDFVNVPDPEVMSPQERQDFVDLLRLRMGMGR